MRNLTNIQGMIKTNKADCQLMKISARHNRIKLNSPNKTFFAKELRLFFMKYRGRSKIMKNRNLQK